MALYALGSNGNYQLGLGHNEDIYAPTPIPLPAQETEVPRYLVCGGNHTLVLFPNGHLYACGKNKHGECGLPPCDNIETFTRVPDPPGGKGVKWDRVSAGWECSIFITSEGRVYPLGKGDRGELGLGEGKVFASIPHGEAGFESAPYIADFPPPGDPICSVSTSITHTVVCLESGAVYGWGAGRKGQLGEPHDLFVWKPRRVEHSLIRPTVVAGRDFTMMVDSTVGGCILGKNRWDIQTMPFDFFSKFTDRIYASWNSVFIQTVFDEIMVWGRNDKGQIPPAHFSEKVELLAAGSEHGVCTTRDGRLWAWGWNEHGNCGVVDDEGKPVNVVHEPTIVQVPSDQKGKIPNVKKITAGCATTWFWVDGFRGDE